jgi:hypothetical protein
MDPARVLTAFREELIAAGLGRRPSDAGGQTGQPYPFVIEPIEGPPAPGELADGENDHTELVCSLIMSGSISPLDSFDRLVRRRPIVDVRYRTKTQAGLRAAMALDEAITDRLIRAATNYGVGFTLGTSAAAVVVLQASPFADFGPISRSRANGFDHVTKWALEVTG